MRAVLINPPPATEFDKHWARFPVLGLAYLAASLRDLPCEVFLLDGKLENLSAALRPCVSLPKARKQQPQDKPSRRFTTQMLVGTRVPFAVTVTKAAVVVNSGQPE